MKYRYALLPWVALAVSCSDDSGSDPVPPVQCATGLTACGSTCVDLKSSGANCGACGTACASNLACSSGKCSADCEVGKSKCGQDCVDLTTSAAHCGTCNNTCGAGMSCANKSCGCTDSSQSPCSGKCVSTGTDTQNCGACGHKCGAGETCKSGKCSGSGTGGSGGAAGGAAGTAGSATGGTAGSATGGTAGSGTGGTAGAGTGGTGGSGTGGTAGTGGTSTGGSAGSGTGGTGGSPPPTTCASPATPADTTGATVVGTGTPASCTEAALDAALASASVITFNCGAAPHTIQVTSQKAINKDMVLDGGGTVTLSGGGTTRILKVDSTFDKATPKLTVQNLSFTNGYTGNLPGTETSSGGAAIYRMGGSLTVINSTFTNNVGPTVGQDVAGGAIYSIGVGETIVMGSTFTGNKCSSGGALGHLFATLRLVNSTITGNEATGNGGNPGNGGNGGGVYMDGNDQTLNICGTTISNNKGNARGGGVFRVSNNGVGPSSIDRTTVAGNQIPDNNDSQAGGLYLQGLQLQITNSTVSGNTANSAGGMFIWNNGGLSTFGMTNVTVAENTARSSLGGGMSVDASIPGTLLNVTIARNHTLGAAAFAAAISGGNGLTLKNCVIADQTKVFVWENVSCNQTHPSGGGNFQWPSKNQGGQDEKPCAGGITFADPLIGALQDNGGPTQTILPGAGSPVIGAGSGCPPTDQRGQARNVNACTAGAVEVN